MTGLALALRTERRTRLETALSDAGLDVLVVVGNPWRSDYLRFAVDVTPVEGHAIALVPREGPARLIVESPSEAAGIGANRTDLLVTWSTSPIAAAVVAMGRLGNRRVALAPHAAVPYGLARGPLGSTISAATALLDRLMLSKSTLEVEAVRRAAALADAGYDAFRSAARVGRPEYELAADTEAFLRGRGSAESFMLLATGGRDVRGMHPPGERRLAAGDLVTAELAPCLDGYYAQICRTLVIGPPRAAYVRAFAVFREALEAGVAAVRPGATAGDVARAENDVFRRHGLGDYVTSDYTRVRGHGVGLYVDGTPLLEHVDLALKPDMTLVVHPNTYHPEVGYVVLGDTVRVTTDGCEVLCRTPRELFSTGAS